MPLAWVPAFRRNDDYFQHYQLRGSMIQELTRMLLNEYTRRGFDRLCRMIVAVSVNPAIDGGGVQTVQWIELAEDHRPDPRQKPDKPLLLRHRLRGLWRKPRRRPRRA